MRTSTAIAAICATAIMSSAASTTAATLITSSRIKDETIQSRDIRNGTIRSWDIAPGVLDSGGDNTTSLPRGAIILADFCPTGYLNIDTVRLENGYWSPMYDIDRYGYLMFRSGYGRSLSLCEKY